MVGPQDTYEAGPNGNEVLAPNPGTNIQPTIYIYIYLVVHLLVVRFIFFGGQQASRQFGDGW